MEIESFNLPASQGKTETLKTDCVKKKHENTKPCSLEQSGAVPC